ncbi:unnamed protein product [Rotaria magnacalcarata]|uniref:Uncharacterized protein n=2 Tax=Rotaria magnacalcarata TaxID=392030 RepID=A0A815ULY4_9BILA|nr:unnamed protein product [Rotaria magnacalcarata]CAF1521247.1 unnamed protein product [Rotaria magnacalcarata]CAF1968572.1 unnamed protein product [Rotaria magnacalcarata]CAF2059457.1 unnamed protein product [Rotaria magnacalcarata]CAF3843972.1 unnamed protein product [Rotaria magnacalcarata]
MSSNESLFNSLTHEDRELFDSYKDSINSRIHETFSSIPTDYEVKPLSIHRQLDCDTFYTYKVALPDHQIAEVSFHLGGKRAVPLIGPPHFEITKSD